MNNQDLDQLHRAYVQRMKAHPPSTWSSSLLSVVINAVDLQFGPPTAPELGKPRLSVVTS